MGFIIATGDWEKRCAMNRQARILIVDDLEKWRKELALTLQREGCYTDSASTISEVLLRLRETLYHLLILDIRLKDSDPNNIEGINLLRELDQQGLGEATAVVILSAYGTQEQMRLAFKDFKVADFLSKDHFTKAKFLESVQQVFSEMRINLMLPIQWQQVKQPEEVIVSLEIGGIRLKRNLELQRQIAFELDDLLCRLFYRASSVLVRPLAVGQSATGVLWVQPFYDKREAEDFGSYYQHASIGEIATILDHLFLDTCSAWYANAGELQLYNLTEDYQDMFGFTIENLERAFLELHKYVQVGQRLVFKILKSERTFTNPLLGLDGPPLVQRTYTCITHGDLNQHNLFIDTDGHTWLIDFQATGQGHILRDVAQLDSEIRFLLLASGDATLEERLCMEDALCRPERFSQVAAYPLPTKNPLLAKAYAVVVHLRTLAHTLVARNPDDDISEYYIALFYNAMNTLRFYKLSSVQREHALLCASLLADQIGLRR